MSSIVKHLQVFLLPIVDAGLRCNKASMRGVQPMIVFRSVKPLGRFEVPVFLHSQILPRQVLVHHVSEGLARVGAQGPLGRAYQALPASRVLD
jgi:hypothetical protein